MSPSAVYVGGPGALHARKEKLRERNGAASLRRNTMGNINRVKGTALQGTGAFTWGALVLIIAPDTKHPIVCCSRVSDSERYLAYRSKNHRDVFLFRHVQL